MVAPGSRSRSEASAIRQPVRKLIGGSPTSWLKRRANAARETPASSASSATVHGWAGLWCSRRRAGGAVGAVAPRAHAEVPHLRDLLALGRGAALALKDDRLRRRGRVVGPDVGVSAARQRDVPGA